MLFLQFACCGVDNFTDYKLVYNISSVPHSCCDTSKPLVNSTTCPENGTDAQAAYQSGLLYDSVGDIYVVQLAINFHWCRVVHKRWIDASLLSQ